MNELRVRRADRAPGVGAVEYFAQVGETVALDRDLSPGAKVTYVHIKLWMVVNNNPTMCLATMRALGRMDGVTEREARRRVAELESRGHVARERVRSMSGSPQGIRPLASLRTRTKRSDCNRTVPSLHPDQTVRAPGPESPPDRTDPTDPLKREGKNKDAEKGRMASDGSPGGPPPPPPEEERDATLRAAWEQLPEADRAEVLAAVQADNPGISRWPKMVEPLCLAALEARGRTPGPAAKHPPGSEAGNSVPDAFDGNGEPAPSSRGENRTEHNADNRSG